ncbi:SRPBCC domain-containing protein [Streptomyces sp. NPDC051896]|uniref:SRPBCC family protein n=1 Tax=Streptomyces sp. NPDC051896 TaxID=3155416 RepID=UPI00341B0346
MTPQITITRRLPATPAEVYAEWLDPEALLEWMCPHPARPTHIAVDPVEGGGFHFDIQDGTATMVVTGRYLVLEPGRLLKFTWSCDTWADPAVESVVTVSLAANGNDCDIRQGEALEEVPTESGDAVRLGVRGSRPLTGWRSDPLERRTPA